MPYPRHLWIDNPDAGEATIESLEEVLWQTDRKRLATLRAALVVMERGFDRPVEPSSTLTDARARDQANETLAARDAEVQDVRSLAEGLEGHMLTIQGEIESIDRRISEARVALEVGTARQKADVMRRVVAPG